jgi:D-alanine-D-alanine ligase
MPADLQYPLFVKPALLGSSIGITRVTAKDQIMNALEVAAHYDDKILVEQAVPNLIEVTLPIMGNDTLTPAFLEQPLTKPEDFFDFDTKYMNGGKKGGAKAPGKGERGAQGYQAKSRPTCPGPLRRGRITCAKCLPHARLHRHRPRRPAYRRASQKGLLNEVNPLPGSLYSHNWRQKGISGHQLVTDLIRLAEERHAARARLQTTFSNQFFEAVLIITHLTAC